MPSRSSAIRRDRSEEHTSELQSRSDLVCRLLLEKNDQADEAQVYDTIVLDPPAFAKSKASLAAALRGYKEINLRAFHLLSPGGVLVTASCSFHIDEAAFERTVLGAAADAGRSVQVIERRGAARDHPTLLGVPETRYLKCLILRAL